MATQQGAESRRSITPDPGRVPTRSATREERIAASAYRRAEERDFAPGLELDDWLSAEREIDDAIAAEQLRSSTPSTR